MTPVRIKGTDIRFELPDSWGEVGFSMWLNILACDNDEAQILSVLSDVELDTLLDQGVPELSEMVVKKLHFLKNFPSGFDKTQRPKTVEIDGKLCRVPDSLGSYFNWRESRDVYELIKEAKKNKLTIDAVGLDLLSIVFFRDIKGYRYKDVTEIEEVKEVIGSIPALIGISLSHFFLTDLSKNLTSGKLELKKPQAKTLPNKSLSWQQVKSRYLTRFVTFMQPNTQPNYYAFLLWKYSTYLGIALLMR